MPWNLDWDPWVSKSFFYKTFVKNSMKPRGRSLNSMALNKYIFIYHYIYLFIIII